MIRAVRDRNGRLLDAVTADLLGQIRQLFAAQLHATVDRR